MKPRQPAIRHPARDSVRTASTLFACCLLLLAGCETTSMSGAMARNAEAGAAALAAEGRADEAASAYIGLATGAAGAERDRLTLLAIEQWLIAGDSERAETAWREITRPPAAANAVLEQSVHARILLGDGDAARALELLEALAGQPMPTARRLSVDKLRAEGYVAVEQPARAVEIMRQREAYLDTPESIERNRVDLWDLLTNSSPVALRDSAGEVMDSEVLGWLTLAALSAATGQQGIGWNNGTIRWREQYGAHPAIAILDELPAGTETLLAYPRQIALLLPLSGQAERAGQAVQNGFLGAYFASAGGLDDRQSIRVYDVNSEGGAAAAYDTAVADGAEFVVGPLLRNGVAELANTSLVPVPVLTLNYLAEGSLAPPGLFQYALAPEDEAVSAAARAILDGYSRAVALVPNSAWGRRLLDAFRTEFEALGGTVLDARSYASGNPDFSGVIEDLMALTGSVQRYQRLRANIGGPLQFDPRRRQDAEFIFLAADAQTGRLMKSQLKFHYSGDLPVYATSLVYAMDGRSDSDLDGIRFADAPWLIAPQNWIERLPALFAEYFPDERRLARLHAMGYDAYQLTGTLYAYGNVGDTLLDGASGELFLDSDGRVHRRLAWAEFRDGKPTPLPEPDAKDISGLENERMEPDGFDEPDRRDDVPGIELQ